jgi:hypothetical protein
MKRLKADDYTKWLRRDLWTLQQALFLLLEAEPPTSFYEPSGYGSDEYPTKFAQHYQEYFELAEDAILLKTLKPFEIFQIAEPTHEMKFYPKHILEWARTKQLDIPAPLEPILNRTSTYPSESTSAEPKRAKGKEVTHQRNQRLQQDAEKLALEQPAWNKGKIAFELTKRPVYELLQTETIERIIRIPSNPQS